MSELAKRGLEICYGAAEVLDIIDHAGEAASFMDVKFTPEFLAGVFLGMAYTTKPGKRGCAEFAGGPE